LANKLHIILLLSHEGAIITHFLPYIYCYLVVLACLQYYQRNSTGLLVSHC